MGLFGPPNIKKLKAEHKVRGLIKALKHEDVNVRQAASQALGEIRDVSALEPLVETLKDRVPVVRAAAVQALGEIGDAHVLAHLIEALNDIAIVRAAAAQALGKIGDPRSVEPLVNYIQDSDNNVRHIVVQALGRIGDPRAVNPTIAMLSDKSANVRATAAIALELLGWKPKDSSCEATFWVAKNQWDQCVKMGSASVLPLINVLKDDNPLVRRSIIQALGEIGDVRAVQPIVEMLHDEQVRNIAIQALGEIGDVSAVQSIVEMLWDEKVCQVAIQVLDGFGWEPENSESGALYWIGKQQWNECVKIGSPAVEPLIRILDHKEPDIREAAAKVLGGINDAKSVEPLIERLKEEKGKVRIAAANSLVNLYINGQIDDSLKMRILTQRDTITKKHLDEYQHSDNSYQSSDCTHSDITHTDLGIGVNFPI